MLRLERRGDTPFAIRIGAPIGGLIVAGILVAILLAAAGIDPGSTYLNMAKAAFTQPDAFSGTLVNATPLVLTGLCAAMAFRLEVYNIGGEGQLYMGAMAATAIALVMRGQPGYLVIIAMIVTGAIAGGLWSFLPGIFRSHFHANEILTSLMLNYVAGLFITYLIFDSSSYWRDLSSAAGKVYPTGKTIPLNSFWPN
ncbi:MAG: ABC transporter permease, partial [Acidimicrobiales bacterium]